MAVRVPLSAFKRRKPHPVLQYAGKRAGDDLDEILEMVIATRGETKTQG